MSFLAELKKLEYPICLTIATYMSIKIIMQESGGSILWFYQSFLITSTQRCQSYSIYAGDSSHH